MKTRAENEENTRIAELVISLVLRGGVILSGSVIGLGLFLTFLKASEFKTMTESLSVVLSGQEMAALPTRSGSVFFALVSKADPSTIMSLGLMILITLPIVRVAFTVGLFVKERDYIFLTITTLVLGVLLFGLVFGKAL